MKRLDERNKTPSTIRIQMGGGNKEKILLIFFFVQRTSNNISVDSWPHLQALCNKVQVTVKKKMGG